MYQNKVKIAIEYGKLENIMNWCRNNCKGTWSINDFITKDSDLIDKFNLYEFIFDNEQDYIVFNLKFK